MHGCHALEFNGTIAAQSGIPRYDAAGACARTSPKRRHAVPSKSQEKSENRAKKVEIAPGAAPAAAAAVAVADGAFAFEDE